MNPKRMLELYRILSKARQEDPDFALYFNEAEFALMDKIFQQVAPLTQAYFRAQPDIAGAPDPTEADSCDGFKEKLDNFGAIWEKTWNFNWITFFNQKYPIDEKKTISLAEGEQLLKDTEADFIEADNLYKAIQQDCASSLDESDANTLQAIKNHALTKQWENGGFKITKENCQNKVRKKMIDAYMPPLESAINAFVAKYQTKRQTLDIANDDIAELDRVKKMLDDALAVYSKYKPQNWAKFEETYKDSEMVSFMQKYDQIALAIKDYLVQSDAKRASSLVNGLAKPLTGEQSTPTSFQDQPLFQAGKKDAADVSPTDILQSKKLNDCAVIGSLQSIAQQNPNFIKEKIKQNPDGSFSVSLFKYNPNTDTFEPHTEIVKGDFYGTKKNPTYAQRGGKDIWGMVYEAAIAQMQKGFEQLNQKISEDIALQMITGKKSELLTKTVLAAIDEISLLKKLQTHFEQKQTILFSTIENPPHKNLVGPHAYSLQKIDVDKKILYLRNPHDAKVAAYSFSDIKSSLAQISIN